MSDSPLPRTGGPWTPQQVLAAANRPPAGEAAHRVDLAEPDTLYGATVVCLGDDSNECRWWCAEPGADCETCGPGNEHRWAPLRPPSCRIADWINAVGVQDTYAGDEKRLRVNDDDTQPGIVSSAIETEWTGDDYVWSYPPDAAERAQPAPVPVSADQLVLGTAETGDDDE